ncbi:hypothetical protein [Streptomyces gardneri]|uniref:Uncharacterized protein n=1 Tax=Streptomyces gardneri TaxID=66892 RepID=A0A4Y3RH40_9ACTN|nr:hypothetical protein [Streptomyces gardneri]GEB57106.1 hypothetical protein SGA01_27110 [Streptomyces gardneri]GHH16514.1 hypothetical protein GCM10017674_66510 [Streptomyces gardneri]
MATSKPSRVLIDQTMLCEAARLLLGADAPGIRMGHPLARTPDTAERLVHLATLLDALLLYDELYVLDAQLPHDADTLPLRQVLLDRRILRPVDTRALSANIADELTGFLRDAETFQEPWSPRGLASGEDVANSVRLLLAHPDESGESTNPRGRGIASVMRGEVEGDLSAGRIWSSRPELQSDPLRTLGWTMLSNIGYFHSGAIYGGVSHLRTFVYWRVSAHLRIPFLPSLHRLPAYHLITDHVRRTVQDRVYEVVADSFRTTVDEVYEDENPAPLYLPPALALFLNHLRAHGDIAMAVDDLRHQHRKLRRALAELQQSLESGSTLGDAKAARHRLNAALDALRGDLDPHDQAAAGTVDQLIDIVPGVVNAAANPLDVGGYAEALVARPAEWIRSWWLRRPVRSAIRLSSRLDNLSRYHRLLGEATGQHVDPGRFEHLRQEYGAALTLYGGDSRLPAATPSPTAEPPEQEAPPRFA